MPAAVRPYLRGRDIGTFTLTPLSVAADGTLSEGTAQSLAGVWEQVTLSFSPELTEISAADAVRKNYLVYKEDLTVTVREIMQRSGGNYLQALTATADYFKLILARGGRTWTVYLIRGEGTEEISGEKSTFAQQFRPFDPTVANPAYA